MYPSLCHVKVKQAKKKIICIILRFTQYKYIDVVLFLRFMNSVCYAETNKNMIKGKEEKNFFCRFCFSFIDILLLDKFLVRIFVVCKKFLHMNHDIDDIQTTSSSSSLALYAFMRKIIILQEKKGEKL